MKKTLISVICAATAGVLLVSSMAGCSGGSNNVLNANKDYAVSVISDYNSNSKAAEFEFSDHAYAKGNTAAMLFKADAKAEDMAQIARNLFLTSITVTNEKGDIVACYPEGAESGKLKDSKDKSMFNKVVKGISDKLMDEPVYNAEADTYSVLAGVKRTDADGAVIIGFDSKEYSAVTGTDLSKLCGANNIVIRDDQVLCTNIEGVELGINLDGLGIKDDDLKKESFTFKVGDKSYTAVAATKGDITVICAA